MSQETKPPRAEHGGSRRDFLKNIGALCALSLAAAQPGGASPAQEGKWIPAGALVKLKKNDYTRLERADLTIYLLRGGDDSVLAVSSQCTHLGCTVDWQSRKSEFHCPCHGGTFDSKGTNIAGPPKRPLTRLATSVDPAGIVMVFVPARSSDAG